MHTVNLVLLPGLSPLTSRVVRRARGRLGPADIAVRTMTYGATTTTSQPPTVMHFPDELERITGVSTGTSLAMEMRTLRGTTHFESSLAYELPEVAMIDGILMRGRFRHEIGGRRERLAVRRSELPVREGIAIASSVAGNQFFGHAIVDDLVTAIAAKEFGDANWCEPPTRPGWVRHVQQYRVGAGLELPVVWNGIMRATWVFRDPYLNDSKLGRLELLRSRLARRFGPGRDDAPLERLFARRRGQHDVAHRAPLNEEALEAMLASAGWRVIDPTEMTLADLAREFGAAKIVAGVEGSQLCHTVLLSRPGTTLLTLQPPDRFNLLLRDFADRLGMRFGFHVGSPTDGGWSVDPNRFLRLVDLAEHRAV